MNRKEWLIWFLTVVLIVLAATLPIFTMDVYSRVTLFELIKYRWYQLFIDVGWWPLI